MVRLLFRRNGHFNRPENERHVQMTYGKGQEDQEFIVNRQRQLSRFNPVGRRSDDHLAQLLVTCPLEGER